MRSPLSERVINLLKRDGRGAYADGGFIGVDIGTASIKVVQLSLKGTAIVLDTYGEIILPTIDKKDVPDSRAIEVVEGEKLDDLIHEVDSTSRRAGIALPLAETFIQTIETAKRDPEQMQRILSAEAKKYIPVQGDYALLEWHPLPQEQQDAFEKTRADTPIESHMQKIMITAVTATSARKLSNVAQNAAISGSFYEIEFFSTVRACAHLTEAPALIIDFGASSTKLYLVNSRWEPVAAHMIPMGGSAITAAIMQALNCDSASAEARKCKEGINKNGPVADAVGQVLAPILKRAQQFLEEHQKKEGILIRDIVLTGGGSGMPGIVDFVAHECGTRSSLAHTFDRVKGPMILEDVLAQDGPRYAVAVGLALRGLGRILG